MGSSGKASGGSKDYYGHCAGVICQGNLDFLWGILINNDLAWPSAKAWDSATYPNGRIVIYLDGNVYKATTKTSVDPTAFPWILFALPWAAGTYHAGDRVLSNGNVWQAAIDTAIQPQDAAMPPTLKIQDQPVINGWQFLCTPDVWSAASNFWPANSIVAHQGRLYINAASTKNEPPNAPWSIWKQDLVGPNPTKITVEGMGDIYVYRGTPDQQLDAVNEGVLSAFGHPPYRNKSVLVLKDFLFGTSQQSPPDIIALGGRKPVQSLIVGASAELDADWQANPWCVLVEYLTHPVIGLGLPNSFFDAPSWQAEADRCAANPSLFYISPLYDSLKKVREIVADLLSYPDAFTFWSTVATLVAGHWPHHEAAPAFDGTNTIDRNSLLSELDWQSGGWGDTASAVGVSFSDIASGFKSRPVFAPNLFNQQALKRMQVQKVDRPHIVRASQALAWATEFAKISGDQTFKGALDIRAEKATAVKPGSLFLLTDDVSAASLVQRCTKKTIAAAPSGKATIGYQTERGVSPEPYSATPTPPTATAGPSPVRIGTFGVAQLPNSLGSAFSLAVIAGRSNEVTQSFDAWFRQADGAAYQNLGTMRSFAVPGLFRVTEDSEIVMPGGDNVTEKNIGQVQQGNLYDLGATGFWNVQVFYADNQSFIGYSVAVDGSDYVADPTTGKLLIVAGGAIATGDWVDVKFTNKLAIAYDTSCPQADLDLMIESLTEDEINDGKILAFAFQADSPSLFEIMVVQQVIAAGTSGGKPIWFVDVRRAQFDTKLGGDGVHKWGYNSNDVIFLIRKASIVPLQHESFEGFFTNGALMDMRLVPSSAWVAGDVADVFDAALNPEGLTTPLQYNWNTFQAPTGSFGQTNVNGAAIGDFTATFLTTDSFSFTFELDDVNADLVQGSLVATQGQEDVVLWTSTFDKTAAFSKTSTFVLPAGTWGVELRMIDSVGNHATTPLLGPDGQPVQLHVEVPAGGGGPPVVLTAESPKLYSGNAGTYYETSILFGLHPGDITIKWQITARNVAYNPAAWYTGKKYSGAISGLYRYGTDLGTVLPPVKRGKNGQTLWAFIARPGYNDSPFVFWNF